MANNAAEQIKEKLDLVEFLRGYLELKPAGNNFKANCPFHKEKTPSFMVSPERQIWHCFGCNEGGDIFKFLMKYENLEFYEALKILAEKANIPLARVSPSEQKEFGVLYDINRAAADYYIGCLSRAPAAGEYLSSRKLSKNSIEDFEIGFAPNDYESLSMYLLNKGFEVADSLRAGLIVKTERGNYIDRFRGRIMFPLESNFGKVIGFTGRVLPQFDTGETGKYMNSPETPIFSKSRLLYGLSKSKESIRESGTVLLVEGQMDVIMSHQDGVKNTVGTSGTALTDEQLMMLRRYSSKLVLNFDNDEAGKRAMERSIDLAHAKDFETEVLDFSGIPETGGLKDPADIVSEKPGILKDIVSRSVPAMEYYFTRHPVTGVDIGTKKQSVREILKKIMNIPSAVERSHWLKELSFRSGVRESDLLLESKSFGSAVPPAGGAGRADMPRSGLAGAEKPARRTKIASRLISLYFVSDTAKSELERVRNYLPQTELGLYNAIVSDPSTLDEAMRQKIAELSLKSGLEEESIEREISDLADNLELEALIEERDALSVEIKSNRLSEEEKTQKFLALMEIAKRIETIKIKK
jgi:DNA primase